MHPLVARARAFAIERHGEQTYDGEPYVVHLDEVAALVAPCGPDVQAAAYLHDVVEDTETTIEEVQAEFGAAIAQWVMICTDEEGQTRHVRKFFTHKKLSSVKWATQGLVIKIADRLCNLRRSAGMTPLFDMYRHEHADFKAAAYREGWCEPWWAEMEEILNGR